MSGIPAIVAAREGSPPWEGAPPSLDRVERGDVAPVELAWSTTLRFVEDIWASAALAAEPAPKKVAVRLRPLVRTLAAYLAGGRSHLPLDDLQRAAGFLHETVRSILARPNTRLARTHALVRWERVDELDARSVLWMSRLPGRTTRQKSAATPRALGVVRGHTLDLSENRVLVRLARDLRPCLEQRIATNDVAAVSPSDLTRRFQLTAMERLLREDVPSVFGSIGPALRPEPNNALLGSGRYGKVWRTWQWLARRQERFDAWWRAGRRLMHDALGLLIVEGLVRRRDAVLVDDLVALRLDGAELGLKASPSIAVLIMGANPRCITIESAADGTLRIETRDAASAQHLATLEVELAFAEAWLQPGRGCPVRAAWLDVEHELLGEGEGWFDAEGVGDLVDDVVAALDLDSDGAPLVLVAGSLEPDSRPRTARLIGVDLAAAVPALADETGSVTDGKRSIAIDVHGDDGRIERVVGDDALAVRPDRRVGSGFFLVKSWDQIAAGEAPIAELASALAHVVGTEPSADRELCVPVPDALGEPGEALLRTALPSSYHRVWLVPRAVAAAIALRARKPEAVGVDECLVVLDCGPLGFEGRLMVLRSERAARGSDPHSWECPLPWPSDAAAASNATRTFWRDLTHEAIGPDVDSAYVERLVDSGTSTRVARDVDGRPGAALLAAPGQLGPTLTITAAAKDVAARRFADRFGAWLASLPLSEARAQAAGGRLHVLVIGEPLELPAVAAAIGAACTAALPEATYQERPMPAAIASGAVELLRRIQAREPTFERALPDLYLTSLDAKNVVASRPIFANRRVRPGEEISVPPIPFELPAHAERIELPLEREPGGRRSLAFRAVLEGEGLPLTTPLPVDLHVTYRYAEDGFRIRIRPRHLDARSLAFAEREVRWVRAETTPTARTVRNEPPEFPMAAQVTSEIPLELVASLAAFKAACDKILTDEKARRQGTGIRDLCKQMNELAKALAPFTRSPSWIADTKIVNAWLTPLCLLAGCSPSPHPKGTAPRWAPKAGELRKLPRVVEAAFTALGRLGHRAPRAVPEMLLAEAQMRARNGGSLCEQDWMTLGRTVEALQESKRGTAAAWAAEVCARADVAPPEIGPWWALATMLWSEESRVCSLAEDVVERLLRRIEELVVAMAPPRIDVFHEIGIVLLALLRRRGRAPAGPVDAGTPRLRRLAEQFEDVDRSFVTRGTRREPRLALAGQNFVRPDVSAFVDTLAAALRGERVALIRMLED